MQIASTSSSPFVRVWLNLLIVLVVSMVWLGGVTRLTESGLSIVEWKLLSGTLPPISEADWQREFAEYQTSPEFVHKNNYFGLNDFKKIFWLEYLHRLLGRIIGLAFLLPFGWLLLNKHLPVWMKKRMAIGCLLVGMQGTVGWIMVQSGLVDTPRVHPIKLALHLSLAFSLFSLLLWTRWQWHHHASASAPESRNNSMSTPRLPHWLVVSSLVALIAQIVLGALVAGNDAGLSYNTYPLMDGAFIPSSFWTALQDSNDWVSSVIIVQCLHRITAHILVIFALLMLWHLRHIRSEGERSALQLFCLALLVQFILGVATLVYQVPIALASAHQLVAMVVLGSMLRLLWLRRA